MPKTVQKPAVALDGQTSFRQPAHDVLARVRDAMKGLIDAVPGPVSRAVELQNSLGIYWTLAWQAFKVATAPEPLDVTEHILTPAMTNTLLAAAEKKGVPHEVINEVRAAMDMYAVLLHEHAGDTDALMMMVASLRSEKKTLLDEKLRKGVFQHNRLIWGQQADVNIGCLIVNLSDDVPSSYPTIMVIGRTGYHQFRPVKKTIRTEYRAGHSQSSRHSEDSTDSLHDILTEFSSPELKLEVAQSQNSEWNSKTQIVLPDLGRKSTVNVFQLLANNFRYSLEKEIFFRSYVVSIYTMLHLDIMILGSAGRCSTSAHVYGRVDDQKADDFQSEDLLPIELSPVYLGSFVDMPPGKGIPRYSEMIRSVLRRFGYYGRKFDVYRCRMPYPILNSAVYFRVDPTQSDSGKDKKSANAE